MAERPLRSPDDETSDVTYCPKASCGTLENITSSCELWSQYLKILMKEFKLEARSARPFCSTEKCSNKIAYMVLNAHQYPGKYQVQISRLVSEPLENPSKTCKSKQIDARLNFSGCSGFTASPKRAAPRPETLQLRCKRVAQTTNTGLRDDQNWTR